jgi:membrane protease YdiL (CAAX protease family)
MIDRVTGPVPAVQPAAATGGAAGSLSFTEMMGLVAVLNLLVLLATPAVLRLRCRATLRDLGLSLEHWRRDVVVGGVAFLLVSPWVYAVHAAALVFFPPSAHPMESMLRQEFSPAVVVLAILSGVILAPAAEELIFRGVLLGWLGNPSPRRRETLGDVDAGPTEGEPAPDVIPEDAPSTEGEWRALVGSALPFAVVHATEMPSPIPIFFLALTLAFVVRRTGSLIPGLVLHGLFNGFSTLMLLGSVL